MDDDLKRELLSEVRKIRRSNQIGLAITLLFVVIFLVAVGMLFQLRGRATRRENFIRAVEQTNDARPAVSRKEGEEYGWTSIDSALDRAENAKALSLARRW